MSQVPVKYAVQPTPTRCAVVYTPPYTIINLSTDNTVWIADNAGIRVGLGTPLYPGTSLRWEKEGEIWAISEGPIVEIVTTNDVTDWEPNPAAIAAAVLNSGVLVIDNPVPLLSVTVNGPGPTNSVDISRFQSLNISIELVLDNPVNSRQNQLELVFGDGGITTYVAALSFTVENQLWTASIPCYGSSFVVSAVSDSTFNVFVSGSHRPIDTIKQRIQPVTTGLIRKDFLYEDLTGLAPLASLSRDLHPWHGDVEISLHVNVGAGGAISNTRVVIQGMPATGNLARTIKELAPIPAATSATYQASVSVPLNGEALLITYHQGATVNNIAAGVLRATPKTGAMVGT